MALPLQLVQPSTFGLAGLGKTEWVDAAMAEAKPAIIDAGIDPAWLPQELAQSRPSRRYSVEEFGCGSYGCVMPTHDPGVVLKITEDASEAWFAYVARELAGKDGWPLGIVRYHQVLGFVPKDHRRELYLLWRDEANDVGKVPAGSKLDVALTRYMDVIAVMHGYLPQSDKARSKLYASALRKVPETEELLKSARVPARAVHRAMEQNRTLGTATAFAALYQIAAQLEDDSKTAALGSTIRYYIDQGIILGDLHQGNVGKALDDGRWVISDPGLVIPILQKWMRKSFPTKLIVKS